MDLVGMLAIVEVTAKWWHWLNLPALLMCVAKQPRMFLGMEGSGTSQPKSMTTLELLVRLLILLKLVISTLPFHILHSLHKRMTPAGFTLQVAAWEAHSQDTLEIA